MNPQNKFAIALIAGVFVILMLLVFSVKIIGDATEPGEEVPLDVKEQIWTLRSLDMLVLVVMIFACALGVLALVGGEFKWR